MRRTASHGERLLCTNPLQEVNGNLVNRDQAVLGRKHRVKQLSARERWEAHGVSLLGLTVPSARTPKREAQQHEGL